MNKVCTYNTYNMFIRVTYVLLFNCFMLTVIIIIMFTILQCSFLVQTKAVNFKLTTIKTTWINLSKRLSWQKGDTIIFLNPITMYIHQLTSFFLYVHEVSLRFMHIMVGFIFAIKCCGTPLRCNLRPRHGFVKRHRSYFWPNFAHRTTSWVQEMCTRNIISHSCFYNQWNEFIVYEKTICLILSYCNRVEVHFNKWQRTKYKPL